MGERQDDRRLAAAEQCIEAILAAGTTRLSVEHLRLAAGISKRTFHRYFPFKAQAIRPAYAAISARFAGRVASEKPKTVPEWAAEWSRSVLGDDAARALRLFRLVRADPEFWSVFLEVVEDGERILAEAIAEADDVRADEVHRRRRASVTAVAVVASSRLALAAAAGAEADPIEVFSEYLTSFGLSDLRPT
jgi:AcrR family transcriptional regulator